MWESTWFYRIPPRLSLCRRDRQWEQAFIKQKLNARAFFRNNWHEVKYVHEAIHAGSYTSSWLTKTGRLFPPLNTLFVQQLALCLFSLSISPVLAPPSWNAHALLCCVGHRKNFGVSVTWVFPFFARAYFSALHVCWNKFNFWVYTFCSVIINKCS